MAKKNVTKEERETIVNYNEADDTAVIYTFNNDLKKRLASRVSIRLVAPYSEERRKAASEYAKKHGIGG